VFFKRLLLTNPEGIAIFLFNSGFGLYCDPPKKKGKNMKNPNSLLNTYKCKKYGHLITEECHDTTCEWRIKSGNFLNCTWIACIYGPFTLEEVGEMMGVTRERIRQIEAKALKKLQHKKRRDQLRDFALSNEWDV